jgi:D-glycero-alpha-D-manno-heptose-7-phosphate kinase
MLIVRTPVRISFAGGGTDLPAYYQKFGGAVLSSAINKHFYTILQKRSDGKVQVISSDLRVVETWEDIARMAVKGSELEIPLSVMKELGCAVSVNLFLASEIPPGTGLGSSASVCVNVLKTLATYLGMPMSKYELAERAFHVARNSLGKPVGKQDEYAASFGGINFIQFNPDESVILEPVDLEPELVRELQSNLMLFFTGAAHHSWTILKEQEQSTTTRSGMTVESLHEIRELADTMCATLKAGNLDQFGGLLHKGWEAKKRVSDRISTSRIDGMYGLARDNGAIGGKITGAGGGGFLLLYCPQVAQQAVRERLTESGAREMSFEFDSQGAQVVVDDPFIDGDERGGMKWTFEPVRDQVSA